MGRSRKKDKGLPERVYIDRGKQRKDGSWPKSKYYLKKDDNTQLFLGNTEIEMRRNHLALIERPKRVKTTGDLIDDYLQTVAIQKGNSTYELEISKAKFLRVFFKDFYPDEITAQDIYEYMDIRAQKQEVKGRLIGGKRTANQERSLLANILNYGIRKGLLKDNPVRHVKPFKEKPRDRYPEDWELKAVYIEASPILQCMLDFAYLSGQRRGDILFIQESQISEDGIRITQQKTKEKVNTKLLIEWSESLKECVNRARKLRGNIRSMYLFCKEDGQPYKVAGFKSMYKRAMEKALAKGVLKEKFNFHDLRAKTYSDDKDEQQRIKRAGHVDASMGRVYDRKEKVVKPLK
jgi:integrase